MFKSEIGDAGTGQAGIDLTGLKGKLKELLEIEMANWRENHWAFGPRFMQALLIGFVTGAIVSGVLFLVDFNGLLVWTEIQSSVLNRVFNLLPIILGVFVFSMYLLEAKQPKSWYDTLYAKLTRYEPVDKDAYRRLQQDTRDLGFLSDENLSGWVWTERSAIKLLMMPKGHMRETFLDKKV